MYIYIGVGVHPMKVVLHIKEGFGGQCARQRCSTCPGEHNLCCAGLVCMSRTLLILVLYACAYVVACMCCCVCVVLVGWSVIHCQLELIVPHLGWNMGSIRLGALCWLTSYPPEWEVITWIRHYVS